MPLGRGVLGPVLPSPAEIWPLSSCPVQPAVAEIGLFLSQLHTGTAGLGQLRVLGVTGSRAKEPQTPPQKHRSSFCSFLERK